VSPYCFSDRLLSERTRGKCCDIRGLVEWRNVNILQFYIICDILKKMHENQKTKKSIEQADLHEFQSPREMFAWVVDRFDKNEMPHDLNELREMADEINTEGREQGFQAARMYVDAEGRLLTVARKEGDEPGLVGKTGSEKACRISIDEEIIELTLPSELQGRGTMQFISGSQVGTDCIYDLKKYNATGGDYENLPEGLQRLVALYGDDMVLGSGALDCVKSERHRITRGVGLSNIEYAEQRRRKLLAADEEEAYEIEHRAQGARANVKRGLFMAAKKHAQLQDEAYRRVTKYPNIDKFND